MDFGDDVSLVLWVTVLHCSHVSFCWQCRVCKIFAQFSQSFNELRIRQKKEKKKITCIEHNVQLRSWHLEIYLGKFEQLLTIEKLNRKWKSFQQNYYITDYESRYVDTLKNLQYFTQMYAQ